MKKLVKKETHVENEDFEMEFDDLFNPISDEDLELVENFDDEVESDDEDVISDDENKDDMGNDFDYDAESHDDDDILKMDTNLVDLSGFTPAVSNQQIRRIDEAGVLSVVHSKNGMRVSLSKELMEQLGNPLTIQIGLSDNQIAIAEYLGNGFTSYSLSKSGAKKIIYRSELVKQITERYALDFTDRTSITFHKAMYSSIGNQPIALITVKA